MREDLLKENKKVQWVPEWAGKRFENWLESLGDWPIGRQRYWGIPLPIWVCKSNKSHIRVVGNMTEIGSAIKSLHRPYVDKIILKCKECGSDMKRVQEVLDVWFDSGLSSWASLGWPKKKDVFDSMWPADLNIEGPDQIRGWWNSQLIASMIVFGKAPYKTILFHGFMLDAHGAKMSKSKGNIATPSDVTKKGYGIDALRWYLLSNAAWDNYFFNWKDLDSVAKSLIIFENSFNFVQSYVTRIEKADLRVEDRWLLSRLNGLVKNATEHMESYNCHKALQEIRDFVIDEWSRIYIKLIRDRVWPAYGGDNAAFYTLYMAAKTVSRMLAPFVPFLAEDVHQKAVRKLGESIESIHLCPWPIADQEMIDTSLDEGMLTAQAIIEGAMTIRLKNQLKLRWPLKTLVVGGDDKVKKAATIFNDVIKQMANVKEVDFGHASWQHESETLKLWLDTELTPELKKEASVKELVRHVQEQRKKAQLVISDKINLCVKNLNVAGFENFIMAEVGAAKLTTEKVVGSISTFEFDGNVIEVGIEMPGKRRARTE
jgi:isoleucyl-tRNA synthetase